MSDYKNSLYKVKKIPKIYLGQEVKTPIGKGIVIKLKMDYNGLYLIPERSIAVVWFSTSEAKDGWLCKEFKLSELEINFRKEKLQKINSLDYDS